jgi:hypothetical protein
METVARRPAISFQLSVTSYQVPCISDQQDERWRHRGFPLQLDGYAAVSVSQAGSRELIAET